MIDLQLFKAKAKAKAQSYAKWWCRYHGYATPGNLIGYGSQGDPHRYCGYDEEGVAQCTAEVFQVQPSDIDKAIGGAGWRGIASVTSAPMKYLDFFTQGADLTTKRGY